MSKIEEIIKIKSFLVEYKIKNATINKDLTVDVYGDVDLYGKELTEIPIQFRKVDGDFICSYNNLTSLKGCPREVGRDFYCCNNNLTSFEYCPTKVGNDFDCAHNQLISFKGCPKKVGGSFYCMDNQFTSLGEIGEVGKKLWCDFFVGYLGDKI